MDSVKIQDMVGEYIMWYSTSYDQDIESRFSFPVFTIESIEYTTKKGTIQVPVDKVRIDILNILNSKMMD